tara:strand:- start:349 stop:561 length:213 start_codon:yes stop_codon:yes gene_type:complete
MNNARHPVFQRSQSASVNLPRFWLSAMQKQSRFAVGIKPQVAVPAIAISQTKVENRTPDLAATRLVPKPR